MKEENMQEDFGEDVPTPGKKKKWLLVLVACVLAAVLFIGGYLLRGWTDPPQTIAPTMSPIQQAVTQFSPTITGEPESNRLIRIGFAQCDLIESDRRKANTMSIQNALNTANGYELIVADGQNDHDIQLLNVAGFIQQGADYIVIAPVQENGWDAVLQQAKGAGIPVIFVDRTVNADDDLYVTWIGSDFKAGGIKAMEWLESFIDSNPVKAVYLQGVLGSLPQVGRSVAFDVACVANGWENLSGMSVDGDAAQAKEIVADWLEQFPDLNVVIFEDDNMSSATIQAIEEAGQMAGGNDGITIISFDANRRSLQLALDTEKINCLVESNPLQGPYVADVIQKLEAGETIPKTIFVDDAVFDWRGLTQTIIDARTY